MLLPHMVTVSECCVIFKTQRNHSYLQEHCFQFNTIYIICNKQLGYKAFSVLQIISLGQIPRIGIIRPKYVIITRFLTHIAKLLSNCHIYLQSTTVIILPHLALLRTTIKRQVSKQKHHKKTSKTFAFHLTSKNSNITILMCMRTSLIISFNINLCIWYFPLFCEFSSHVLTCQSDASNTPWRLYNILCKVRTLSSKTSQNNKSLSRVRP